MDENLSSPVVDFFSDNNIRSSPASLLVSYLSHRKARWRRTRFRSRRMEMTSGVYVDQLPVDGSDVCSALMDQDDDVSSLTMLSPRNSSSYHFISAKCFLIHHLISEKSSVICVLCVKEAENVVFTSRKKLADRSLLCERIMNNVFFEVFSKTRERNPSKELK